MLGDVYPPPLETFFYSKRPNKGSLDFKWALAAEGSKPRGNAEPVVFVPKIERGRGGGGGQLDSSVSGV